MAVQSDLSYRLNILFEFGNKPESTQIKIYFLGPMNPPIVFGADRVTLIFEDELNAKVAAIMERRIPPPQNFSEVTFKEQLRIFQTLEKRQIRVVVKDGKFVGLRIGSLFSKLTGG